MKLNYSSIRLLSFLLFVAIFNSAFSQAPAVRLKIDKANFNDETLFYFQQGGTPSFQSAFDAYKLVFNQATQPYLGSLSDSILTSINGLPELPVNLNIRVKAITPVTASYTFSAEQTDFPTSVCVTLYDAFTGISTNILSSNYVCTLYDTTSMARFTMNFFTLSLNASSQLKQANCLSSASGMICAKGTSAGPWNYEWRKGDSIVKISLNKNSADSLENLDGGNYSLKINTAGQCDNFSKDFTIDEMIVPTSKFTTNVTSTNLSNSGFVAFKNNSYNAKLTSWDFGDNSGTWYIPSPSHNYYTAGIYTVTLISESITHCKSTSTQIMRVVNDVTGIHALSKTGDVRLATLSSGNYELLISFDEPSDLELELVDPKGSVLKSTKLNGVSTFDYPVDLNSNLSGMYLLKVKSGSTQKTFKLLN